eukprot:793183-Pyramimonas_sp.AAC.1
MQRRGRLLQSRRTRSRLRRGGGNQSAIARCRSHGALRASRSKTPRQILNDKSVLFGRSYSGDAMMENLFSGGRRPIDGQKHLDTIS